MNKNIIIINKANIPKFIGIVLPNGIKKKNAAFIESVIKELAKNIGWNNKSTKEIVPSR
jgi:hypothetical protein